MKSLTSRTLLLAIIMFLSGSISLGQKSKKPPTDKELDAITLPCYGSYVMNGIALNLGHPEYPKEAKPERLSGEVVVRIYINERGRVFAARALKGHLLLQESALNAARLSIFKPFKFKGRPEKCSGILTFKFVG